MRKVQLEVGDLVRIRMNREKPAPNMYIGVVVDLEYAAPGFGGVGSGDLVKVSFLNPPYYQTAYYDPTDNWFKPKDLEVLSECR